MKIVQALEDSSILLKGVTKTIKNEIKEQKGGFLSTLIGTLGASLLGILLTGKGTVRAGEGTIRAGCGSSIIKKALIPPHPLTNIEIITKMKQDLMVLILEIIENGAYVVNLHVYQNIGTHWIALHCTDNEVIFFYSFGIEHIPLEIKKFISHKNIKTNIFRLQANNSIMCGYCSIKFIDFMLKDTYLFEFTSFFSPYDFKKNDDTILSYFK